MGGTNDENDKLKAGTLDPNPLADAERARLRVVQPNDKAAPTTEVDAGAERALLGALLWSAANQPDLLRVGAVLDLLEDGVPFGIRWHGDVFDAMRACVTVNAEHDAVAVNAELVKVGRDRSAGGLDGLRALANDASTVSERQARIYATAIRTAWVRRDLVRELRVLAADARSPQVTVGQILERAQTAVESLSRKTIQGSSTTSLAESTAVFLKALKAPGSVVMATGLRDVDEVCNGGLRPGEVSIIAADTSVGKSLLSAQIAEHVVTSDDKLGALYVTLEMPHESFTMRLVSARSGVPLTNLRKKVLNSTMWAAVTLAASQLAKKRVYFADDPSQTMMGIYAAALERSRLLAQDGKRLGLLVIDHVGLVKPSAALLKKANREQQVAETSRGLRFLAARLGCHVLGLVQINRDAQGKGNEGVPKLRHLAESYALARDPDLVFILHRDRDPKSGELSRGVPVAFVLAKGRMDESAAMLLGLSGARFYDHNGTETFADVYGGKR